MMLTLGVGGVHWSVKSALALLAHRVVPAVLAALPVPSDLSGANRLAELF
jgi:hypothetical protein